MFHNLGGQGHLFGEFYNFIGNEWNLMKSHEFCYKRALFGPDAGNIDIPIGILMVLEAIFPPNSGNLVILAEFL